MANSWPNSILQDRDWELCVPACFRTAEENRAEVPDRPQVAPKREEPELHEPQGGTRSFSGGGWMEGQTELFACRVAVCAMQRVDSVQIETM